MPIRLTYPNSCYLKYDEVSIKLREMLEASGIEPKEPALPPGNHKSAVQSAATAPLVAWERDQSEIMEPEIKRIISERKTHEARAKEIRSKAASEKDSVVAASTN